MSLENRTQILFIARYLPTAKGGGAEQRVATTLEALAMLGDVHFLLHDFDAAPTRQVQLEEQYDRQIKTVVRAADLARTNPTLWTSQVQPSGLQNLLRNAWVTTGRMVPVTAAQTANLVTQVRVKTQVHQFHLIVVMQAHCAMLVTDALSQLLLDSGKSYLDWDAAEAQAMKGITRQSYISKQYLQYLRGLWNSFKLEKFERKLLTCWDVAMCASHIDTEYFQKRAPGKAVYVLPNSIHIPSSADQSIVQPVNNHQVVFVATMNYWPNAQGALMFLKEIWPKVKAAVPDAEVKLVGRGPSAELRAFDGRDGIHVIGEVDAVGPYYGQAAVAIAPMTFSVGSAIKILEALAYKKPLVGFEVSTERHGLVDGVHVVSAKTCEEFADKLIKVLTNSNFQNEIAKAGYEFLHHRFDKQIVMRNLSQYLFAQMPTKESII